ncbi:MAG: glycosyltransferase [Verrucomicrobiae bacterium]|nr:glycosyltransferase [Verrucomicrobiae bacterium]
MKSLSVIMPAYNEGQRIADAVERTRRQLAGMTEKFQVVVVNDGSEDNTREILAGLAERFSDLTIVDMPKNRGKGEALRQGFLRTTGELIFFLDADMDLPVEQIGTLLETMGVEGADAVIGSKMHPLSRVDYPIRRRMVSWIYFTMTRILFGLPVRDTQTGLKLFRREVLERCMPRMLVKAFAYDLELLAMASHFGYHIAEAPVVIEYRRKYGHFSLETLLTTGIDTLAIFYRLHILEYYDCWARTENLNGAG